jgi:16S rRNA (adenine1518-N6/adenine1519-N6)-dimethyltransferase
MKISTISGIREVLKSFKIVPEKRFGQHFLIDKNILKILINTAELTNTDLVVEIGAGLGIVTEQLLEYAKEVIAIEQDRHMFAFLEEQFRNQSNLKLICADARNIEISGEMLPAVEITDNTIRGITKLVANLPYSIASRILVNLVSVCIPVSMAVITVQLEVAERIKAYPGSKEFSFLSLAIQSVYDVRIVKRISASCFYPEPNVRSAIIKLVRHENLLALKERQAIWGLAKKAFMHRRKQLAGMLVKWYGEQGIDMATAHRLLKKAGVSEQARPEQLGVAEWHKLMCLLRTLTC